MARLDEVFASLDSSDGSDLAPWNLGPPVALPRPLASSSSMTSTAGARARGRRRRVRDRRACADQRRDRASGGRVSRGPYAILATRAWRAPDPRRDPHDLRGPERVTSGARPRPGHPHDRQGRGRWGTGGSLGDQRRASRARLLGDAVTWDRHSSKGIGVGGTLAGNVLSARAISLTLANLLTPADFDHMRELARQWSEGVRRARRRVGICPGM